MPFGIFSYCVCLYLFKIPPSDPPNPSLLLSIVHPFCSGFFLPPGEPTLPVCFSLSQSPFPPPPHLSTPFLGLHAFVHMIRLRYIAHKGVCCCCCCFFCLRVSSTVDPDCQTQSAHTLTSFFRTRASTHNTHRLTAVHGRKLCVRVGGGVGRGEGGGLGCEDGEEGEGEGSG